MHDVSSAGARCVHSALNPPATVSYVMLVTGCICRRLPAAIVSHSRATAAARRRPKKLVPVEHVTTSGARLAAITRDLTSKRVVLRASACCSHTHFVVSNTSKSPYTHGRLTVDRWSQCLGGD